MKKLLLLYLFILISFYCYADTGITSRFIDNKLNITGNGISFKNCSFAVHIIVDNQPMTLSPQGVPEIQTRTRQTPAGNGDETSYTWVDGQGYRYSWLITTIDNNILSVRAAFVNGSKKPVYLSSFELITTPDNDFFVEGKASEWMLSSTEVESRRWGTLDSDIPTEGELEAEGAYSTAFLKKSGDSKKYENRAWRGFYEDIYLYREPGKSGVSLAAVDSICDVYYHVKVNQTKMKLEVIGDMSEILIDPDESRLSDEVLLMFTQWDKAQLIKNFWIADVSNVRLTRKPVFGWCSWYRVSNNVTQENIYNIAGYTKKNSTKIPLEVIQIDDGWQLGSLGSFNWSENGKFTRGFSDLTDSIKAAGAIPGIWLSPGRVDMIQTEEGKSFRPFPASWYTQYKPGNPSNLRLDPTHPDARNFMYRALRDKYNDGFRYFKLDFSQIELFTRRFHNPKLTRFQAQKELYRLFRNAIGADSYLLACGCGQTRALIPFIDALRIGTDTNASRGFGRELASDGQPGNIHGFWYPIISISNKSFENGILANGDPDCYFTGQLGKCRPQQLRTFASFVGLYGGFAMVSDLLYDKNVGTEDHLRMLEIFYPVSKDKGHPFAGGWDMYGKEYGYISKSGYGTSANVILWNPHHQGTSDLTMKNVKTDELGKRFHAWSFWDEKYIGIIDKNYIAKGIPFYEHQLLRFTPLKDQPVLIGSNLHISMGSTEVKGIDYSSSHINIELDPNAGSRKGRLYFYSEKPLGNARSTNSDCFIIRKSTNIYIVVLTNRIRDKKELITLDIGEQYPVLEQNQLTVDNHDKFNQSTFSPSWLVSW